MNNQWISKHLSLIKIYFRYNQYQKRINNYYLVFIASMGITMLGLTGCGKKCDPQWYESLTYKNECSDPDPYFVYVSSGFPTASGTGLVTKWTKEGSFVGVVYDYSKIATNVMPQGVTAQTINGVRRLVLLGFDGTNGRVDNLNFEGTDFTPYFTSAGLTAGSKRITTTASGGYLVARTAGVEFFNSSTLRIGAPLFATSGSCTISLGVGATEAIINGINYVVTANAAVTPNNKLNLHNGSTGTCIAGAAPAGPATTLWPVDIEYAATEAKLFVLYYPFTASTSNAQIWRFDVSATTISNGTLVFNDTGADIASISATPAALSSSITFYQSLNERFVLVSTANNSVIKFAYDGNTLTKVGTTPFIYQSGYSRSVSDVFVQNQ